MNVSKKRATPLAWSSFLFIALTAPLAEAGGRWSYSVGFSHGVSRPSFCGPPVYSTYHYAPRLSRYYGSYPHYSYYRPYVVVPLDFLDRPYNYYESARDRIEVLPGAPSRARSEWQSDRSLRDRAYREARVGGRSQESKAASEHSRQGRGQNGRDALLTLGQVALQEGRYYEALNELEEARKADADDPVVNLAYGEVLFSLGRYEAAAAAIRSGLENVLDVTLLRGHNLVDRFPSRTAFLVRRNALQMYVSRRLSDDDARFLLGYVRIFSDERDKGFASLQAAAPRHLQAKRLLTLRNAASGKR